ncbi:sigma-70 family RNA polymerase sigma factor [Anaerocolumna xylanovorans]|uniref:RNA polymerase sigma-70 factor, ECF subfamily n=1 Tax=Anaerocolumna xylanovorans DSM 12503 TaxID=1121345 RepID=A0A1M7Y9U7_9FIRM|nr:sigma-70 family RNA polymerase sigma factor [Anaerocolumna xylanovorans]SHO49308.1 RNA polymerase sigma-70 factor, ECF subfamily [Anaerocolumna xylanovorans DSM 12503]
MKVLGESVYAQLTEYITGSQNSFYRLAYSYLGNREAALDAVQNSVCKALENYQSIRNPEFLKTWFYRVLANECIAYRKKYQRDLPLEEKLVQKDFYYQKEFEAGLNLYEKVNRLPDKFKTIIILHYYEDMTLKEISEITNVNLNTVKTRLYAGIKKLQKAMKGEELL